MKNLCMILELTNSLPAVPSTPGSDISLDNIPSRLTQSFWETFVDKSLLLIKSCRADTIESEPAINFNLSPALSYDTIYLSVPQPSIPENLTT